MMYSISITEWIHFSLNQYGNSLSMVYLSMYQHTFLRLLFITAFLAGCSGTGKKHAHSTYQPDFQRGMYVYNQHCATCHNTGSYEAPVIDVPEDWDTGVLQPSFILQAHVDNGFLQASKQSISGGLTENNVADALYYIHRKVLDAEEKY